jgi:hypothetical protein
LEYEDTIAVSSEYEDSELSDDNEVDLSDAESSAADKRRLGRATELTFIRTSIFPLRWA